MNNISGDLNAGVFSIADTTLGASATTIDITGLGTTYAHLTVRFYLRTDVAGLLDTVAIRFNNDSGTTYDGVRIDGQNAAVAFSREAGVTKVTVGACPGASAATDYFGTGTLEIPGYAQAHNKTFTSISGALVATAASDILRTATGVWRGTAAINRITLLPGTGTNFVAGSRVTIYAMGT